MDNNQQLTRAISLATSIHYGQYDKGGKPYILHPLHLMNQFLFDLELAVIAVLHDTIEDSSLTIQNLKEFGFSYRVTTALDLLTHKPNHTYEEYIKRISLNYDSIRVKRKDLEHNSDITRLKGITDKDFERMIKYHKAFLFLEEAKKRFQ